MKIDKAIEHFNRTISGLKYLDNIKDDPSDEYYARERRASNRRRLEAMRIGLVALKEKQEREVELDD